MDVRAFCADDTAVSSVLGVILMVAITIILAAIVGTFVLGIGQGLTSATPQTAFEYSTDYDPGDNSSVTILHAGGDAIEQQTLEVTIGGQTAWKAGQEESPFDQTSEWPKQVTAGDRLGLEDDGSTIDKGDEVLLIWTGESKATILSKTTVE
jgi:FlaG/FlaF family flagellin (archaellin)